MRITQKRLRSGERLPRGYGLAYYEDLYMEAVCYPVPINWVVWTIRELWTRLRCTPQSAVDQARARGYAEGFDRGWTCGFEAATTICQQLPVHDDSHHPLNRLARGERL